jgi:hypothetical protein
MLYTLGIINNKRIKHRVVPVFVVEYYEQFETLDEHDT